MRFITNIECLLGYCKCIDVCCCIVSQYYYTILHNNLKFRKVYTCCPRIRQIVATSRMCGFTSSVNK